MTDKELSEMTPGEKIQEALRISRGTKHPEEFNPDYKKLAERCLLSPLEVKRFCKKEVHGYGDININEYEWDIDGLLKFQLLEAIPIIKQSLEAERLDRPELRKKIEAILEPTLDRLYHQDLPEGKYEEVAIKASIGMLKSNLTTQILALIPDEEEIRKAVTEEIKRELEKNCRGYEDRTVGQLMGSSFYRDFWERRGVDEK